MAADLVRGPMKASIDAAQWNEIRRLVTATRPESISLDASTDGLRLVTRTVSGLLTVVIGSDSRPDDPGQVTVPGILTDLMGKVTDSVSISTDSVMRLRSGDVRARCGITGRDAELPQTRNLVDEMDIKSLSGALTATRVCEPDRDAIPFHIVSISAERSVAALGGKAIVIAPGITGLPDASIPIQIHVSCVKPLEAIISVIASEQISYRVSGTCLILGGISKTGLRIEADIKLNVIGSPLSTLDWKSVQMFESGTSADETVLGVTDLISVSRLLSGVVARQENTLSDGAGSECPCPDGWPDICVDISHMIRATKAMGSPDQISIRTGPSFLVMRDGDCAAIVMGSVT
jgi:hypothetical protein